MSGTDRWFTLQTQVTLVAPTSSKTSWIRLQAATKSEGVLPFTSPPHGYQNPSISWNGWSMTGPPNSLIASAYSAT